MCACFSVCVRASVPPILSSIYFFNLLQSFYHFHRYLALSCGFFVAKRGHADDNPPLYVPMS